MGIIVAERSVDMQVIEQFIALSRISRCSHQSDAMRDYLVREGERLGYTVDVDATGNVFCHKTQSALTLQAHYDMVCIGTAPEVNVYEEEGWLKAEQSTLGADNGIGMAMMLCLMREGAPVDALFTADEEVGLVGARALDVPLKNTPLLNLDSEAEGEVTIGCAGGVDLMVFKPVTFERRERYCYRVDISGLPGGHSGVDIHKAIPNAIKALVAMLESASVQLAELSGGERRNSIPKHARAVVASETELQLEGFEPLGRKPVFVCAESDVIIAMLHNFVHGVRRFDAQLDIVHSSINLALVSLGEEGLHVQLSARSMEAASLKALEAETTVYFERSGCEVASEGYYAPWTPEPNEFAKRVLAASRNHFPSAAFSAIHAGLECGVIRERYPNIDMASIGPNIVAPHSTAESVEIASVVRVYDVVKTIVYGNATSL